MSKNRIFADGMESISFTEGLIRMDLYNLASPKNGENTGNPKHEVDQELIMNPQGFIRAFAAMERLVNQLVDAGLIKRGNNQNPQNAPAAPAAQENKNSGSSISVSPNFE